MPRTILLSLLCIMLSGHAQALDRLSPAGVELGSVLGGPVERSVDLDGDQPVSTFVVARMTGNLLYQRTASGEWKPWDGDPAGLVDSRLPLGVGTLVYRVEASPVGADALILGYRTPDTVKFGILGLGGRQ